MNKTIKNLNTLLDLGVISNDEYESQKKMYITCLLAVTEFERIAERKAQNAMNNRKKPSKKEVIDDTKNKIFNMYAEGLIDEDDMNKMIRRLH